VSFNVQNLFDRNPPIIPSYGSRGGSQTVSDNYDPEGRRYQLSVN
jgi:outer membrane receptor protein involved in Fe transport